MVLLCRSNRTSEQGPGFVFYRDVQQTGTSVIRLLTIAPRRLLDNHYPVFLFPKGVADADEVCASLHEEWVRYFLRRGRGLTCGLKASRCLRDPLRTALSYTIFSLIRPRLSFLRVVPSSGYVGANFPRTSAMCLEYFNEPFSAISCVTIY